MMAHLRAAKEEFFAEEHREPTEDELAQVLGVPKSRVRTPTMVAIETTAPSQLSADVDVSQVALDNCISEVLVASCHRVLSSLPEEQQRVVELRFGLYDGEPKTITACAMEMGISRERASRSLKEALNHIRESFSEGHQLERLDFAAAHPSEALSKAV